MPVAVQFDTLRYVEKLISAGMPEKQAKAGAEALAVAFSEWGSGFLATKSDISDLRSDLKGDVSDLKAEVADLRSELKGDIADLRTELKGDIADLRAELQSGIAAVRGDLKSDISGVKLEQADMKSDIKLMKWMLATTVAGVVSLVSKTFF